MDSNTEEQIDWSDTLMKAGINPHFQVRLNMMRTLEALGLIWVVSDPGFFQVIERKQ